MRTKTQKTKQKDKTETKMKIIAYFRKNENCAGVGVGGRMHRLSGTESRQTLLHLLNLAVVPL